MSWQKPSPESTIDGLTRRITELERTIRRGKSAPNVRDLGDTDTAATAKATNGQVLAYSFNTGRWRPQSVGSGGPLTARVQLDLSAVPVGSEVTATSWTVGEDNIGLTINGSTGAIAIPAAGTVIATAWAGWAANANGSRVLRLNGYWTLSQDERQAVSVAGRVTRQTATIIEHYTTSQIADAMNVRVAHYGTGSSLDVGVPLSVAYWPD